MGNFRWANVEKFISLVNLLSMRNGGQVVPSTRKEDEEDDASWEDDSTAQLHLSGREDELKQKFLDRFAELLSRDKGGKYVCCVALRESGSQNIDDDAKVSLLVTRNKAFEGLDRKFCGAVQKLLTTLSESVGKALSLTEVKEALWEELLCYYQPRLDNYASDLKVNLKAFKADGFLDSKPIYDPDSKHSKWACNDVDGTDSYSEDTHDEDMKLAKAHIRDLDLILSSESQDSQRRLLVEKAYSLRHITSIRVFLNSCSKTSLGHKILSDILFLGRLRSCYFTMVDAAECISGFSTLSIVLVDHPSPRTYLPTLPPLADVLEYLHMSLDPGTIRRIFGEKWTVLSAERHFKECQTQVSRKHLHTHAEVQLVLHLTKNIDIDVMNKEIYPYIGCSKLSCFLCSTFLASFRKDGLSFGTRGCHGKVYWQWSIPDLGGLQNGMDTTLDAVVKHVQNVLVRELLKLPESVSHVAESSVALTNVYSDNMSYLRERHRKEQVALMYDHLNSFNEVTTGHDTEENADVDASTEPPSGHSAEYGECQRCERETSRKCSKCSGPWLCGQTCEKAWDYYRHNFTCALGRPLDSADYLIQSCYRDLLPEDDETLEDFRFHKFVSAHDRSHLFGLYIGLIIHMEVGSRELHQWQVEGKLTENIISKYEAIPKQARGGYYPWFLKNLHIFEGPTDQSSDMLTIARPYLEPADRSKKPHELNPEGKRQAFILYGLLLNGYHPNPTTGPITEELYMKFGFCVCDSLWNEARLNALYNKLISKCTFKEFWTALESKTLLSLFDLNGLKEDRKGIMHLETVLDKWGIPSVWYLQLFTQTSDMDPTRSVYVDYGFSNCRTIEEKFALKGVYKKLLETHVDRMELHAACISGKLYEFVSKHDSNLDRRFKGLMKNPYPLAEYDG